MMRLATATTAALLLSIALLFGAASAVPIPFFAEDLNFATNPELTRLLLHPNADATRLDFLSKLEKTVGTEDFEAFADDTSAPLSLVLPGAGTATLNGNGFVNEIPTGTNTTGRFPISANKYWDSRDQFSIQFSEPIAAFGFYGIDFGDFNGQVTLDLVRRALDGTCSGPRTTVPIPHTVDGINRGGSVIYFGVIDREQTLCGVEFGNTSAGFDVFGFDDMTIASLEQVPSEPSQPVPSPASLLLVAGAAIVGLSGLAGKTRRV